MSGDPSIEQTYRAHWVSPQSVAATLTESAHDPRGNCRSPAVWRHGPPRLITPIGG